jgi:hypothetical protein
LASSAQTRIDQLDFCTRYSASGPNFFAHWGCQEYRHSLRHGDRRRIHDHAVASSRTAARHPNEAFIEFRNVSSELVDVGEVKLNLGMNMTGMVRHSSATIKRTETRADTAWSSSA